MTVTVMPDRKFWEIAQTFPPDKEVVYPEHAIAQEFEKNSGKTVLEYGCGGGSDTLSYLRRGCRVYFTDIVTGNVIETHRRVLEAGFAQHGRALALPVSDALGPIPSESIDVINVHGVLHHIEDPMVIDAVLGQFHRILRPSTGRLYVMLYTLELWQKYEMARAKLEAKGLSPEQAFGQLTDGEGCPFATAYSEEDARYLLDFNFFDVVSTFVYNGGDFRTYRAMTR